MKKYLIFILLNILLICGNAQSFLPGDIIFNVNYGGPQITPVLLKTALNIYIKNKTNDDFTFNIKNSGVFNAKAEYAMMENLGLGFAASYWNMSVAMQNNYIANDPVSGVAQSFVDNYLLTISATAIGIRGNYHFVEELKAKKLDPYFGFTIGTTKYVYGLSFNSSYPDKQTPETYNFFKTGYASRLLKSGFSSYFSSTFGIRYFPVKYLGINLEAGWDRGAFLFGGLAFKLHTKPIKEFND